MSRILITGANGFCGPHLGEFLSRRGGEIYGTYRRVKPSSARLGCRFLRLDIRRRDQVEGLVRKIRPDRIYHLAGQSSAQISWKLRRETMEANVKGTLHLLQAVRLYAPSARTLFVSSSQIHAGPHGWPSSPYAFSKFLAELACLDFVRRFSLHVVIARPSNHTGPGQSGRFVFSDWCRQIATIERGLRRPEMEVGNLRVTRDFLHVDDVVRAYDMLLTKGKAGETYAIGTGRALPLGHYLDYLIRSSRVPVRVRVRKERLRGSDPHQVLADPRKIRRLGWRPRKTVFDALDELLDECRQALRNSPQAHG